jgi:hypothetical protein
MNDYIGDRVIGSSVHRIIRFSEAPKRSEGSLPPRYGFGITSITRQPVSIERL